jgi:hypothetical protein
MEKHGGWFLFWLFAAILIWCAARGRGFEFAPVLSAP